MGDCFTSFSQELLAKKREQREENAVNKDKGVMSDKSKTDTEDKEDTAENRRVEAMAGNADGTPFLLMPPAYDT